MFARNYAMKSRPPGRAHAFVLSAGAEGYLGAFVWAGLTNVPLADRIGQPLSSDAAAA